MRLPEIESLRVFVNHMGKRREAGILRQVNIGKPSSGKRIFFEYHRNYPDSGIPLSPFALKFGSGPIEAPGSPFGGLHGVFADSLPDSWGQLLLDRKIRNIARGQFLTPLQRLACVGTNGMGALEYEPVQPLPEESLEIDLDGLADQARDLLENDTIRENQLDRLLRLNGSAGGARPKIMVEILENGKLLPCNSCNPGARAWIIKFPSQYDVPDIGLREYVWSVLARKFGIEMPCTKLFPARQCRGYFAVQRFDRQGSHKIHVASAAGLLNADASIPCLDYENLFKLCKLLTQDIGEVKKLARLMIFNVVMNNVDDHARNFSFMLDADLRWKLAPAYDLAPQKHDVEHMAAVNGKGRKITDADMLAAAASTGLDKAFVLEAIEKMRELAREEKTMLDELQGGDAPAEDMYQL